MKKITNSKIFFWILFLVLISFTIIGFSYAYFLTSVKGNTNQESVTITAGELKLTYYDGNNTVEINKILPDTIVDSKTFSVKNTGKNDILKYGVYLENLINELQMPEDLDYVLTCIEKDTTGNVVQNCNGSDGDFPITDNLLASNSIKVGYVHEYELVVKYVETGTDQSIDMNKKISGKIQIYDLTDIIDINGTLTNATEGDYVVIASKNKTYKIDETGKFLLPTIEPGYHVIKIVSKDNISTWEYTFEITKNATPYTSLADKLIAIDNYSNSVNLNLTKGTNGNLVVNSMELDNE